MSSNIERCNINSSGRVQGLETEEVLKCSDGSLPPSALFYIKLVHLNWTGKTEQCSHNSWPDSANLTNTPSPLTWVNVGSLNWVRDYFVAVSVCCNQRSWNDWSHSELLVLQDRQWGLWDRKGWVGVQVQRRGWCWKPWLAPAFKRPAHTWLPKGIFPFHRAKIHLKKTFKPQV